MTKKTNPIPHLKRALGAFLRARRENIGWSRNQLRERTNTSGLQIEKIEDGIDTVSTDTLLRVMRELGVGVHLSVQNADEASDVSAEGMRVPPPFLVCADADARQLYVLHWRHPAFLVGVVQTIPHTLRLVATYGPTAEQVRAHAAWAKLEAFVKEVMAKATAGN